MQIKIGYEFNNIGLLEEALTHSTAGKHYDYNRLEYLGDALIDVIVLDCFIHKFTQAGPGSLSKMKATAVSNRTFSYISYHLGLAEYLDYAGTELRSDLIKFKNNIEKIPTISQISKLPDTGMKVMADLFESLIAAIYLDSHDLDFCKDFVLTLMAPHIDLLNPENCNLHPHNRLFDYAQKHKKTLGAIKIERFKVENRSGIEFVTKVYAEEKVLAEGRGPSKLSSSEAAADNFFMRFGEGK